MDFHAFDPTIFQFLEQLADNNNRPWFQENKGRYDQEVFEPAMAFIRAFRPHLTSLSPFFVAGDRRVGGSLMRVYRDTRFFKGEPYKTNAGIQFEPPEPEPPVRFLRSLVPPEPKPESKAPPKAESKN